MTRITNFGRKRTFVEAGFDKEPEEEIALVPEIPDTIDAIVTPTADIADQPPKKKRKRTKKPKLGNKPSVPKAAEESNHVGEDGDQAEGSGKDPVETQPKKAKAKPNQKGKDSKSKGARKLNWHTFLHLLNFWSVQLRHGVRNNQSNGG